MKTTLEGRLAAASANMKLAAHTTFKHPITSILSLCLVAGIALWGQSQITDIHFNRVSFSRLNGVMNGVR